MEKQKKIVVGLDIGTTKICAIVGCKNEYGKLEVLGMGKAVSEGVKRGKVENIDKTIFAIKHAVEEAANVSGVQIFNVNVGIAGQHIKSATHRGHITRKNLDDEITVADVTELSEDMHRIVVEPGNQIIHVMPQDYTVDYEDGIKDPVGMTGVKLEADFHIITAHTNAIKNINRCVERAGLTSQSLILEPLASSLAVLSDEEREAGVCLVDIGGGTTDIAVFYDNIIRHTAVIPFGGDIITSDIKEGCGVLHHQAERLKVEYGKAIAEEASANEIVTVPGIRGRNDKEISCKNLAHIIEARMQEMIELVHTEIICSKYLDKLAGGIVLTGGGAQLSNLQQLVEYMTGLDTRIGYPNEHLGKSKSEEVKSPMYATTIGLVLAGFQELDDRANRYAALKVNKPAHVAKSNGSGFYGNFFTNIMEKTKKIMIDDFDDSKDY